MSTKIDASDPAVRPIATQSPWAWLEDYLQYVPGKNEGYPAFHADLRIVFEPGADREWSVYTLDGAGNQTGGESFTHSMEVPLVLAEMMFHLHTEGLKRFKKWNKSRIKSFLHPPKPKQQ